MPSGANATWTFDALTTTGASIDNQTSPTAGEIASYPNTTNVTTSTVDATPVSKMYTVNNGNLVSVTGIESNGVQLNLTNNATIGQFPTDFGYTNSDTMSGTYVYGTYSGNFSGTINTAEDAYGILNLTIDGVPSTYFVNRLKSVQNITLSYLIFPNVGTIQQTIYSYYEVGATSPIFRNSSTHIVVPAQSIDTTTLLLEKFTGVLGVNEHQLSSKSLTIYPNPVENVLNFRTGHRVVN